MHTTRDQGVARASEHRTYRIVLLRRVALKLTDTAFGASHLALALADLRRAVQLEPSVFSFARQAI